MAERRIDARRLLCTAAIFIVGAVFALALRDDLGITRAYFRLQDFGAGLVLACALVVAAFWRPNWRLPDTVPAERAIWGAAGMLVLALWAGTYLVMLDYPLTRDEHMVVFDAAIYRTLALAAPLPAEWSGYGRALAPDFLLDVPGNALLVSAYMPGNAAMRAAFGLIADPALMNPLLAGAALIALYRIALRLFPRSPGAVWVCLGAYVLSAQVLVNAMTTYAMTGHLVLNLVWLALFLSGGRWAHAGAMVIGAWAIGLHQIIFHPLFAGPLILTLLPQRRWGLFAAYASVYAASLLFWISYQGILTELAGIDAAAGSSAGAGGFLADRVLPLLTSLSFAALPLMTYNVLRFLVFAPAFLLPLMLFARQSVREGEGIALPLAAGILLTFLAMMILLPYQGHGWGYRYWHAVLPNFVLLCGYGYAQWAARDHAQADGTVGLLAGATVLGFLPFLLVTSHLFVKPHAELAKLIGRQKADFVIVEAASMPRAIDNVRNSPWLANQPLVFASRHLTPEQVDELCRKGTVAVISEAEFRRAGFEPDPREVLRSRGDLVERVSRNGCYRRTNGISLRTPSAMSDQL